MPDTPKRLQIVFVATGAFAVPSMRRLCDCGEFEILCLVTNPVRYDKSGKPIPTPAREFAAERGVLISDMNDVHSREFSEFIYLYRPDLLFVCDFGQILSEKVLKGPILGGVNLHGSLLPKYRGAAPVHWAILNDEPYTGISIIHMTPRIDAGPVIAQSPPIPIGPRETVLELEERLADYGAELVLQTIRLMSRGEEVRIIQQIDKKASKAPRLKKEDGLIDWSKSSKTVFNHIRAMNPWPKSYTDWIRSDGTKSRLILGPVLPLDDDYHEIVERDYNDPMFVSPILMDAKMDNLVEFRDPQSGKAKKSEKPSGDKKRKMFYHSSHRPSWWKPGTVIKAEGEDLIVAAGDGTVRILQVQPTGKKMMSVRDFLLGNPLKSGDHLE